MNYPSQKLGAPVSDAVASDAPDVPRGKGRHEKRKKGRKNERPMKRGGRY